jgi:hypothetical protein
MPRRTFLIALVLSVLLFAVSWEPVVQGKAGSLSLYILYSLLYVAGAASFYWSFQIARRQKSKNWQYISGLAIALAAAWLVFLIYASILGYYWAKAWEQSNWQF